MSDGFTLLVAGNCHAAYLARAITSHTAIPVAFYGHTFGFMRATPPGRMRNIRGGNGQRAVRHVANMRGEGRRVILVEQYTPRQETITAEMRALFGPEDTAPLVHAETKAYFPATFLGRGWREEQRTGKLPRKLKRRLDIDRAAIEISAERAGMGDAFAAAILDRHQEASLFHTPNHPSGPLCGILFGPVLGRLEALGAIDAEARAGILDQLMREDGISAITSHPLPEPVVDALELKWGALPWYRNWIEAHEAIRRKRYEDAAAAAHRALADHRASQHVWLTLARALEHDGDFGGAHQAYGSVFRAFPDNAAYCRDWLRLTPGVPEGEARSFAERLLDSMSSGRRNLEKRPLRNAID